MADEIEKRRQIRARLRGYIADIADGNFIYGGIIEDVSYDGLRLNDLPLRFAVEGRKYCIVVSGGSNDDHYKLSVTPRWRRKNGASMDVGFKVSDAPREWKLLLSKVIPKETVEIEEEDVWDQFSR
jgi:hypothetical protein